MKKLLVVLFAFVMAGCLSDDGGDDNNNPSDDLEINNYFPLSVGNTWTYQGNGVSKVVSITNAVDVNGIATYEYDGFFSEPELVYLTSTSDSVLINATYNQGQLDSTEEPIIWFKVPSTVGEQWSGFWPMETISNSESVSVPAGDFTNTYLLRMTASWGRWMFIWLKG